MDFQFTDFSLAFYGIESGDARMRSFHETMTSWLQVLGLDSVQIMIGRPGLGDVAGDLVSVSSALGRDGFIGVESVEIIVAPENQKGTATNYLVHATCSYGRYAVVSLRGSVASSAGDGLMALAEGLVAALRPSYAVSFLMALSFDPMSYTMGFLPHLLIAFQAPEDEEGDDDDVAQDPDQAQEQLVKWGEMAMPLELYKKGVLRDLYNWNFLNKAQRSALVEGVPLELWIKADSSRGRIRPSSNDLSLWTLSSSRIDVIRPVLLRNKVIFDYREFP